MLRLFKQIVASLFAIYTITLVYEVLLHKGYHVPIADQWVILAQVIVAISCGASLVMGCFFNLCMLFDTASDTKRMRSQMYNMFQDKIISAGWIVYPVLLMLIAFQYALWPYTIAFLAFSLWIWTSRLVHISITREAKITELN